MSTWRMRDRRTGLFSMGGINAAFDAEGRTFKTKVGVKGSIFHYVYGFRVDDDGTRRFHPRRASDSVDDFEAAQVTYNGVPLKRDGHPRRR